MVEIEAIAVNTPYTLHQWSQEQAKSISHSDLKEVRWMRGAEKLR
jgi:hypothetical protein